MSLLRLVMIRAVIVLAMLAIARPIRAQEWTHLIADLQRPYLYAIKSNPSGGDDSLLFISETNGFVIQSIPVGPSVTDMVVHYGDGRLYVTNWQHDTTRVVDLTTQTARPPLRLGRDVFRINAGRTGRLCTEGYDQWIDIKVFNSMTGALLTTGSGREGDAEIDPTGQYYYHCENNSSDAKILKYDITTDKFVYAAQSPVHSYGSRHLLMSPDGARFFWQRYVFDENMHQLGRLKYEVVATSLGGELVFGADTLSGTVVVFDGQSLDSIDVIPVRSRLLAVSGAQDRLYLYDSSGDSLVVVPMNSFAIPISLQLRNPSPSPDMTILRTWPELHWRAGPLAAGYRVYLGTDSSLVAHADTLSADYLGSTVEPRLDMPTNLRLGTRHFWRVDQVNERGTTPGAIWSFHVAPIDIEPDQLHIKGMTQAPDFDVDIHLSADSAAVPWTLTRHPDWLRPHDTSGVTPNLLRMTVLLSVPDAGHLEDSLHFRSGSFEFASTVTLDLEQMKLTQMVADLERPFVYALHRGSGANDALLVFISTRSGLVEKIIPIGANPTDMTIHYPERRLYVTNYGHDTTRIVDLDAQTELPPLRLGRDVYKINAGRPGLIYFEGYDQRAYISAAYTSNGSVLSRLTGQEGDAEIDPTGHFYYHCESNSSAALLRRYDISGFGFSYVNASTVHAYGSRNLVLSPDGRRLFWQGVSFDTSLTVLDTLGKQIWATTQHGELAFGFGEYESRILVFNTITGDTLPSLPYGTHVMAVSGDQQKLFLFASRMLSMPMGDIAPLPPPITQSDPVNGDVISLPRPLLTWQGSPSAFAYRVYFGSDSSAVLTADSLAQEYRGASSKPSFDAPNVMGLGQRYFWRVDQVGLSGVSRGPVWSFETAPLLVDPGSLSVRTVTDRLPLEFPVALLDSGTVQPWSVTTSAPWISLSRSSGITPDTVRVKVDVAGLDSGLHVDSVVVTSGSYQLSIPVKLGLFDMIISQMTADLERPYVYALHPGTDTLDDAYLLFINTQSDKVEKTIPIGGRPTDMTVHYGERRLYVTNWRRDVTRVVDLTTQEELPPLHLGPDVYRINAGRPGRVYFENWDQWTGLYSVDTDSGQVRDIKGFLREGDAEVDPTGRFYYHCENNISDAKATRFEIEGDSVVGQISSLEHPYGSRNLILSPDGSKLFWRGFVYDPEMNEIGSLGRDAWATTLHGELAFCYNSGDHATWVYNVSTGKPMDSLNYQYPVLAVSGDQTKLYLFDRTSRRLVTVLMSDIADLPGTGLAPTPENGSTVILPLDSLQWNRNPLALRYQVYLGLDSASVAAADTTSDHFLVSTPFTAAAIPGPLTLGTTYYWRVDLVGFVHTVKSAPWSFTTAAVYVTPPQIDVKALTRGPSQEVPIAITTDGAAKEWSVTTRATWLSLDPSSGTTPSNVRLTVLSEGLPAGMYSDSLAFAVGAQTFYLPVNLESFTMRLSKIIADRERPYIYALHPGSGGFDDALLIFVNTNSEQIEKVLPIGSNPTDMSISYGEGRLYVNNWMRRYTRVIDLTTQSEVAPLELGPYVYKINAGRPGRLYYEQEDQWIYLYAINTDSGSTVATHFDREGDGEVDPSGHYYYHSDNNISDAHLHKYDVSQDGFVEVAAGPVHAFGSRNLVMSADGSRLFARGFMYNQDLHELGHFAREIITTTSTGQLAIGCNYWYESNCALYNTATGDSLITFPYSTTAMAIASDDERLFVFNADSARIDVVNISCLIERPGDVNVDGGIYVSDVVYYANYLFRKGPVLMPEVRAGDVNCDGKSSLLDAVYLVNFIFRNGPEPCDVCSLERQRTALQPVAH